MRHVAAILVVLSMLLSACEPPRPTVTAAPTLPPRPTTPTTPTPPPRPVEVQAEVQATLEQFPANGSFSVRFNQPMQAEGSLPPLLTYPWVEGRSEWSEDHTRLTFTPAAGFTPGQSYRVFLQNGLVGRSGGSLKGSPEWQLHVQAAPRLVSRLPASSRLTGRRPDIRLTFDRPMDAGSLAEALHIAPVLKYKLSYENKTLKVHLQEVLSPGTRYSFTLLGTAADAQGVPLGQDAHWEYYLPPLIEQVTTPQAIDMQQALVLKFGLPVDRQSVEAALDLRLDGKPLDGTWVWTGQTQAVYHTEAPLPFNQLVQGRFTSTIRDPQGATLPLPEMISYTTPAPVYITNPPADSEINSLQVIEVGFAVDVDRASVETAFQVEPPLAGEFQWYANALTFVPVDATQAGRTYQVTLGTGVLNTSGQPLFTQPYRWSFTNQNATRSFTTEVAAFSASGLNVQVLDTGGKRAVEFTARQEHLSQVHFRLFQLSFNQFQDIYATDFERLLPFARNAVKFNQAPLVAAWVQPLTRPAGKDKNIYETILPTQTPAGVYLLELSNTYSKDYMLLLLSQNKLVLKRSGNKITAWITDTDGAGKEGVKIGLYTKNEEMLATGATGAGGLWETSLPEGTERLDPHLLVIAQDGDDVTFSGLDEDWNTQNSRQWWGTSSEAMQSYAAYLYTDRPIYRPGQTVHFKAILRQDYDAELSLPPAGTQVTVRVHDARHNVLQSEELVTNEMGTVASQFQLAEGVMLGDYWLELAIDDYTKEQAFTVQEYRKPDIEVKLRTDATMYTHGDMLQLEVDTRYLFGQPVANASLAIRPYILSVNNLENWEGREQDIPKWAWNEVFSEPYTGQTDASGRFSISLPAEIGDWIDPERYSSGLSSRYQQSWAVEVSVDDGSHQTVSAFTTYAVYSSAEELRLAPNSYLQAPEQAYSLQVQVLGRDGELVIGRLVSLEVLGWDAQASGYSRVTQQFSAASAEDGIASLAYRLRQAGFYKLVLRANDSQGNPMVLNRWVYAYQPGNDYLLDAAGPSDLEIVAERQEYAPGESAVLVIRSTYDGPAWLTVERGTLRRQQMVDLTPPMTVVEIPLEAGDAPNVFVNIHVWRARSTGLPATYGYNLPDHLLQSASLELKVPVTDKDLAVEITPGSPTYAPHQEAEFTIQVQDGRGRPVPQAEVSLALVDDAIYSLSNDLSGPMFGAFYAGRRQTVQTFDTHALARQLVLYGGGAGGGLLPEAPVRFDFPDTAAWLPHLVTDAQGQVTVRLALPDNLTRWRLTARAVTADTAVGEGTATFLTQQPIIIQPVMPLALVAGDQASLSALVHNTTGQAQEVQLTLASEWAESAAQPGPALTLPEEAIQSHLLEPGAVVEVTWPVAAPQPGLATVTISAQSVPAAGELPPQADAVRVPLEIRPLAVAQPSVAQGEFTTRLESMLVRPPGVLEDSPVRIEISRSPAGSLLSGLDYLTGYPYGCVEQTMSKALPNAVIGRLFDELEISNPTLEAELPGNIQAGLQRLYGYQHADGGWGWFYDDATQAEQTAWVVLGLSLTAQAGYPVDQQVLERGAAWLQANLDGMEPGIRAFVLYSLSEARASLAPEAEHDNVSNQELAGQARALANNSQELEAFSQAALALALHHLGAVDEANALLDGLEATAVQVQDLAYWPAADRFADQPMASSVRSTALALQAFSRLRPGTRLEPRIVRWLMRQRSAGYPGLAPSWGTTQETAFTILGISEHLLAQSAAQGEADWSVTLNGEVLGRGRLGRSQLAAELELQASDLQPGANPLVLQSSSVVPLYYLVSTGLRFPAESIPAAGEIHVERQYLDPATNEHLESFVPGQLVKVQINLNLPQAGYFLILEDQLPGGLEALNESLNSTSHDQAQGDWDQDRYWEVYGYNAKQVWGDRVSFFTRELPAGRHTYTYLARATRSGLFTALPAECYAMYNPDLWGRSESTTVMVREENTQ